MRGVSGTALRLLVESIYKSEVRMQWCVAGMHFVTLNVDVTCAVYFASAQVELELSQLPDLLQAADFLEIESIPEACADWLLRNLSPTSAVHALNMCGENLQHVLSMMGGWHGSED